MAEIIKRNEINYLIDNNRVFLPSRNINVFPCSRRGQNSDINEPIFFDPEARLNTERTNRIGSAINGFSDSFVVTETFEEGATLVFLLAGYRIEAKKFVPSDIAEALGASTDKIYAHLSIHEGIFLNVTDYYTEILYRQSNVENQKNSLDVSYTENSVTDYFFVGISFTNTERVDGTTLDGTILKEHNLPLFKKVNSSWQLVQTSLLPKIEHGETEGSIKLSGDFTVEHTKDNGEKQTSFKITKDKTTLGPTEISELDVTGDFTVKQVSDEGEEISFEITKHGVGTVNVPLHITKATAIDGSFRASTAASVKNLIVGEITQGEVYPTEGTIKAKKHIETPTLEADESIKTPTLEATTEVETPQLRVNRITSDEGEITVDNKKLIVNKSLEMLAKEGATTPAKATIEQAVVGDLTVKVDSKLKNSTGKITAGNLTVNQYINVGSPAIPTTTAGDIVAKNSIYAENNIVAKNTLKAPTIYQTVNSSDKPVPFIDIVEQANGQWQLQISRASAIEKN